MLPNNKFEQIKVYPNEYINNVVMNRPNSRLLENDLYIYENMSKIIEGTSVPTSSSAPGEKGLVVFDDTYMYVHTGLKWVRTQIETF